MGNIRERLVDLGLSDSLVFDNPSFDSAIIGFDAVTERVIYDYNKMIKCLLDSKTSIEDAIEFIEYNTLRSVPYMGEKAPIVMKDIK